MKRNRPDPYSARGTGEPPHRYERTSKVLGYQIAAYAPSSRSNLTNPPPGGQDSNEEPFRDEGNKPTPDNQPILEELKNRKDFKEHVKNNMWEDRRDKGHPWRMDVHVFVEKYYRDWIDNHGMSLADLKDTDSALYVALNNQRHRRPEKFSLPTKNVAELDAIEDPHERRIREIVREAERKRIANLRASRRQPSP